MRALTLVAVLACFLVGRYNHFQVLLDWEFPLTDEGSTLLKDLRLRVDVEALLLEDAQRAAEAACLRGNLADATALVQMGQHVMQSATPDRLRRLRGMAVMTRMAAAIQPPTPLRPADYRTAAVIALARIASVVHRVLVTGAERMRLKIYAIGLGLRLALSTTRCANDGAKNLLAFACSRSDWQTLDQEHLEAFESLMRSLGARACSSRRVAARPILPR